MKKARTLIILSSLAIILLLSMQVLWILQSAKVKEEQFNHSVMLAMCKVTEAMCEDPEHCASLESCCRSDDESSCQLTLNEEQKTTIDSIIRYYMAFYKVDLDYSFEIVRTETGLDLPGRSKNTYNQEFDPGLPGKYVLRLIFPEKAQFIRAEMTSVFITSIALILIILALFIRTISSLIKNERILVRTVDFVNNMTHEFRTPLSNISLSINKLLKNGSDEDKELRYKQIIQSENERLSRQVDRLLELGDLEGTSIPLRTEKVNIHELLNEVTQAFKDRIEETNAVLNVDLSATSPIVSGDRMHLHNAFSNLLDNALKYAINKPVIMLSTSLKDRMLVIELKDNGIGISKEDQQYIFDRFFRVSTGDTHNVKGFGIGLTYVKKVIEGHKGSITVTSEIGKGSTFSIKLPVKHE